MTKFSNIKHGEGVGFAVAQGFSNVSKDGIAKMAGHGEGMGINSGGSDC